MKQQKFSRKFDLSSRLWLQRQANDPYVAQAKKDGYRSRAAYKLIQLDEKFNLLKPGMRIVDLGAAPGGWSQIAAKTLNGKGKIIAIDLLEMNPLPGVDFFVADFNDEATPDLIKERLNGKADLVMSDIAPNTTGNKMTDHLRITMLAELALDFAKQVLAPDGAFLCKLFQGGADKDLLNDLKQHFKIVRHVKPDASRKDSKEMYVIATGFKAKSA